MSDYYRPRTIVWRILRVLIISLVVTALVSDAQPPPLVRQFQMIFGVVFTFAQRFLPADAPTVLHWITPGILLAIGFALWDRVVTPLVRRGASPLSTSPHFELTHYRSRQRVDTKPLPCMALSP